MSYDLDPYFETYTTQMFFPGRPEEYAFPIEEIAHSLSLQCRYNGHVSRFYSVAEHCVRIAVYARRSKRDNLRALMHDAVEAYLCDVPRPLKPFLPGYYELEAKIEAAIMRRYGLEEKMPTWLRDLDNRIIVDERAALMGPPVNDWGFIGTLKPLGVSSHDLMGWTPETAKETFLNHYYLYGGKSW